MVSESMDLETYFILTIFECDSYSAVTNKMFDTVFDLVPLVSIEFLFVVSSI